MCFNRRSPPFLIETKSSKNQMEKVRCRVSFTNCFTVRSVGRSDGLAILWNDKILLVLVNFSNHYIHTKIREHGIELGWFLKGFYSILDTTKKAYSWDLLSIINQEAEKQGCVIGDFNDITTQDGKIWGRLQPQKLMKDFQSTIWNNDLIDTR